MQSYQKGAGAHILSLDTFDTATCFKNVIEMGGLPTPRVPSEIRDGIVTAKDGKNVDREFRRGAQLSLSMAQTEKPDLIILQSRSPSCGVKQRYDGTFTGTLTDRPGVTAELLMDHGFRVLDVEDL